MTKFWGNIFENRNAPKLEKDEKWIELGFQSNNPRTDFRGMGIWGLKQLVWFSKKYPIYARTIQQITDQNPQTWFSFAITGVFTVLKTISLCLSLFPKNATMNYSKQK